LIKRRPMGHFGPAVGPFKTMLLTRGSAIPLRAIRANRVIPDSHIGDRRLPEFGGGRPQRIRMSSRIAGMRIEERLCPQSLGHQDD
jgi:hypothetical protein